MARTPIARPVPAVPRVRRRFAARCYEALMRGLSRWFGFRLCLVHRRPLCPDNDVLRLKPAAYEFAEPDEEQLLRWAADPRLGICKAFIRDAFRRGDRCYATLFRGELVAYCWLSESGQVPFSDELDFLFDPTMAVCGWKMLTHPEHRGQRLQRYNIAYTDSRALERGHTHVVGYVDSENFGSRATLARLPGKELVGIVGAFRLFGRAWVFRSPGAARAGVLLKPQPSAELIERPADSTE